MSKYWVFEDEYEAYENMDLIQALNEQNKEIERLNNIIEKAVEYIENTPLYETTYDYNMEEELEIQNVSDETASYNLLNILRGVDK